MQRQRMQHNNTGIHILDSPTVNSHVHLLLMGGPDPHQVHLPVTNATTPYHWCAYLTGLQHYNMLADGRSLRLSEERSPTLPPSPAFRGSRTWTSITIASVVQAYVDIVDSSAHPLVP